MQLTIAEAAIEYVAAGFRLCPIPAGSKGPTTPDWNSKPNTIGTVERAARVTAGIGLCHAYSGTCALDVDDWQLANEYLAARGVNLQALWDAPEAVRLVSGRPNRGKLVYRTPLGKPIASRKPKGSGLELRCATSDGKLSVQDVLPPSIHPGTGAPYRWGGADWRSLPLIPAELLQLWEALNAPADLPTAAPLGVPVDEQQQLLASLDCDCDYNEWIKVGMALNHENQSSDVGFSLWDEWSANGAKYPGADKLRQHWDSFGRFTGPQVTIASLGAGHVATADMFSVVEGVKTEPKKERFLFTPAPQYAVAQKPAWIVKGVLPKSGLAVMYGDSGAGKTFVVLDMVAAIVRGEPWRGHRVKQGKVAYLCAEGSEFFARRLQAYQQQNSCELFDLLVCADTPNLLNSDDHKAIARRLKEHGEISIIVVDTLARSMAGGNENASEDMGSLIAKCNALHRMTGALVLLVHHSGKVAANGARGHSSLRAAADAEIAIFKDKETGARTIEIGKQKDGPDGGAYPFVLQSIPLGIDEDGDVITSCVVADPSTNYTGERPVEE